MDWRLGAAANFVVMVMYFAIVAAILVPLVREKQIRANRLGTATAAIFFTCAIHHGSHSVHMILPSLGIHSASGLAMRAAFDPITVVWDLITAAMGIYYWTLRRTYGALMNGAKLFDDLRERQKQALEINDNIVQGLVVAKYSAQRGDSEGAMRAIDETLDRARRLITDQLQSVSPGRGGTVRPGDLARSVASSVDVTGTVPPIPATQD
ncbi:MAG: hypothetical protein JWM40_3084 [Frankiales bacterium]|nr:hypothetical protein [Frankiales bacterium]